MIGDEGSRRVGLTVETVRALAEAVDAAVGDVVLLVPKDTPIPADLPPHVRVLPYAPDGQAYKVNVRAFDSHIRRLFMGSLDAARRS